MRIGKLKLNEGLESVGDGAFAELSMEEVKLPSTLSAISYRCFFKNALREVSIPEGVKKINDYAFAYNRVLSSAGLPETLEEIGSAALKEKAITEISLPGRLRSIGGSAFAGNRLRELDVPESVERIDSSAFATNQLERIDLKDTLKTLGSSAFSSNRLETVRIPKNITSVPSHLFSYNLIREYELAPGTTEIGSSAFYNNELTAAPLPDTLKTIEWGAFQNNKIEKLEMPNSVTRMEGYAFAYNRISDLKLSDKLTDIPAYAFYDNCLEKLELPDSVTRMGGYAFARNRISDLKLSDKLTDIPAYAFHDNCLEKLELPDSIAKIGPYAFYKNNIAALSSDTQNSQLKEIGGGAFAENNLKKAELSDKLEKAAGDAFLNNPGLEEDPDHRVSIILRDGEGNAANPKLLADGVNHMINKSLLIIRRVLSGTDAEIALPERKLLPIGEPYTFTPKASTLYLPVSGEPVTVEKTEETQEIKLPYIKNEQFNPDAINIDLAHARNGKKDTNQPYKLKDYNRDMMMPLVLSVSGSGDIIHIPDAWVYVDLNTPELGGQIENVTWPSNIADLASEYKFEEGVVKVRLKEPITAASALELPFYLKFKKDAPRNFVLDLSGKASVVHNASILKTTDPEKRLGLRASSSYANMEKYLPGGGLQYQGEADGEGFQKIGTERPVSYACRVYSYSSSNQTGAVMLEVVDELPRYRGKNAAGEIRGDLRAQFDPALNPDWELSADGTKELLKKRFSRRLVGDLPRYQLQLSFPGAAFKQNIENTMQFKFGGDSPHTLNGNWKEANEKFSGAETVYEQELLYENSSSAGITLLPTKKPEPGTPEPEKPKELPKPAISVYKRCMSFYGDSSGAAFSGQTTRARRLLYNYNGQQYDWWYPEQTIYKPAGSSHYENVFRDNAADRHEEFVWGIRISARAVNARDISLLDYNLDERMRYSAILIPEEFSSAEIIFYSEDEGEGDILLQKQIYGDRFDIPEDVSEQARSFRIAFTGALENKNPWDTSSASMRVYTRLREPDRQHHSSEGADSYGRSKKNYFHNKASVQVEGYTNEGTQLGTLIAKDETEYII
ncbi:MAG: leucine-rich repeat protein, partial [Lachnospiraceae bacterium]